MKQIFVLIICYVFAKIILLFPVYALAQESGFVVSERLYVRDGPGKEYTIVNILKKDTEVEIIDSEGKWYHVSLSGTTMGWVSSYFIALQGFKEEEVKLDRETPVRQNPDEGEDVDFILPGDSVVILLNQREGWYLIRTANWQWGWVPMRYFFPDILIKEPSTEIMEEALPEIIEEPSPEIIEELPPEIHPQINIDQPTAGSTVSGVVDFSIFIVEAQWISEVRLSVDGLGVRFTQSPYLLEWDTSRYANGWHELTVEAYCGVPEPCSRKEIRILVSNDISVGVLPETQKDISTKKYLEDDKTAPKQIVFKKESITKEPSPKLLKSDTTSRKGRVLNKALFWSGIGMTILGAGGYFYFDNKADHFYGKYNSATEAKDWQYYEDKVKKYDMYGYISIATGTAGSAAALGSYILPKLSKDKSSRKGRRPHKALFWSGIGMALLGAGGYLYFDNKSDHFHEKYNNATEAEDRQYYEDKAKVYHRYGNISIATGTVWAAAALGSYILMPGINKDKSEVAGTGFFYIPYCSEGLGMGVNLKF